MENGASLTAIEQYVIDRVREMRNERGWSQKELAFRAEMSVGFIGDAESSNSRAKYNLNHIALLARAFECSPRNFLPDHPL